MKRLFIKLSIFVLPIMLFNIGYEIAFRHIENDFSYKNRWLSENGDKVEILAIGSSHCYCGFLPESFSVPTFNAGHHSQCIKYDYLVFNKFYKKLSSLKFLIINVSYPDPYYTFEYLPDADINIKNYSIYYGIPSNGLKSKFEFLNGIYLGSLFDFYFRKESLLECTDLGYCTRSRSVVNNNWRELAGKRANMHSVKQYKNVHILSKVYDENMNYMREIIKLCDANNIKVILVSTPMYESYREHVDKEQWLSTTRFCDELVEESENVYYLNFFDDARFVDEDFFDCDHLNKKGAAKLSSILDCFILEESNN